MLKGSRQDPIRARLAVEAKRHQSVLARDPRQPQALMAMSLLALASHQIEASIQMATAAVASAPQIANCWVTLGQALRSGQRIGEAEQAYVAAIQLDATNPFAHLGMGELLLGCDRPEEALVQFDLALRCDASLLSAILGMGHALVWLERYPEALERYEQALALRPALAEAEFAAGFVLVRQNKLKKAESRYRRALLARPDFAAAWMNLGCLLREQGREAYAEAAIIRAVQLRPDMVAGWVNLALLKREQHNPVEAEAHLRQALALDSDELGTFVAWAQFRVAENDAAGARGWLRWALARDPLHQEAHNMLGILFHNERRFDLAVDAFEQAECLGSHAAISNRGNSLLDLGRVPEALRAHEKAAAMAPEHAGARYNLALTQLRTGDWLNGWKGYESRWSFREVHRAPRWFRQPRWHGEPLYGRRILVHAEQGLGDTIQFCRYASLVAARGGFPILQVQGPVERLLRSLSIVRSGHAEVCLLGSKPPAFDLECPLMSLPAVFETTVDSVPWDGPYLSADPEIAAHKREAFPCRPEDRLRVGIAWAGNPRYKADQHRSLHLSTLIPLLKRPQIAFFSLQNGPKTHQISQLSMQDKICDASAFDVDLAEAAALIATLDLVITTDTSIAHLAGAMSKPLWILLPTPSDWRWMQSPTTTPWYPTARLFRQPTSGDWDSVVAQVVTALNRRDPI